MPTLQACPKCGAQFDVSAFSRGQQFRCGACGALIVAHSGAPQAAPAAPAASGRVPGARTPGASAPTAAPPSTVAAARSPRGPQYQPVQRAQEATPKAAAPRAPEREERAPRERERGRRDAGARQGPPMGLLVGGGVGVVILIVLVVVLMKGKGSDKPTGPTPAGGGGAAATTVKAAEEPAETLAAVKADLKRRAPNKNSEYQAFIARLKKLGKEAEDDLKGLYEQYVETPGGTDDAEARQALGYVKFDFQTPEEITESRGLDFVQAAEDMRKKRWLQDEDDIRIANDAKKKALEHARLLREDRVYRAGNDIWANMLKSDNFKDSKGVPYNFAHRWAAPHLICYSSQDAVSEFQLLSITDKKERKKKLAELAEKRKQFEPLLDEKERIYRALNTQLLAKFGDLFGVKNLADEWGGRPDYKVGVRSFQDGCPVVVWIFDSHDSFNKYHEEKKIGIPPGVAGYFNQQTEMIYLFDEGNEGDARIFEVAKNLHEGTHQLHYFFARQINKWAHVPFSQSWIGEGLSEYFGAHKIADDGTVDFIGLNYSRLKEAQEIAAQFKAQNKEYPIVDLKEMVSWKRYSEAVDYAGKIGLQNPGMGHLLFIYEQGWAFFYMCMDNLDGKYRKQLSDYFRMVLNKEEGQDVFRRAFKIKDDDEWEPLQKEFATFMKGLLTKDLAPYRYKPQKRPTAAKK